MRLDGTALPSCASTRLPQGVSGRKSGLTARGPQVGESVLPTGAGAKDAFSPGTGKAAAGRPPKPAFRLPEWMKNSCIFQLLAAGALFGLQSAASLAQPGPPNIKTPAPVIYLSDNLDEKEHLGFCIDTVGRGFADRLHAHSCKPRGGDVQFEYDAGSRRIMSAAFAGKCATLMAPAAPGVTLGLVDCSEDSAEQSFVYDSTAKEFRPGDSRSLCLAVGGASRSAGPFMARSLLLAPCATTDYRLREWSIDAKE